MTALPRRKHPRLKQYDYSRGGCYYVTVSTANNQSVLSHVGRGLAPAAPCRVELTAAGRIAETKLMELEERFDFVAIDRYVIMPTHVHMLIRLAECPAGASPRPTLNEVVGTWKSLTTRACNKRFSTPGKKLFQTSFYEHVVRSADDYEEICRYIENNPAKWIEMGKNQ